MNKKISTRAVAIIAVVIIGFAAIQYIRINELYEDSTVTNGTVTDIFVGYHGTTVLEYSYTANGVAYTNKTDYMELVRNEYKFKGRSFPVIYANKKPGVSEILLTAKRFADHHLLLPDSLNWVKQYER
jgi:hypothetical protein